MLEEEEFTFLLIVYDVQQANRSNVARIRELAKYCKKTAGCSLIALTASLENQINLFKKETGIDVPFYLTDEITLKTIIRSNPGIMLIKNGTILDKWHHNDTPSPATVEKEYIRNPKYIEWEGEETDDPVSPEDTTNKGAALPS